MNEKDYYPILKNQLENLFRNKFENFHLEITATRKFSNKLKSKIPESQNLIFNFLKKATPDITGFIQEQNNSVFIIIEIKNRILKLDDIYQTRKYAELFNAKYALLISTKEIPEEIKRLTKNSYYLYLPAYQRLVLVQFNEQKREFVDWFEKNPFK